MMERRVFLSGLSAAVAGTAVFSPYGAITSAPTAAPGLTRALFERWLGAQVRIYNTDGRFVDNARLTHIEEGPCCAGQEQFSVVFESAHSAQLPERIFRLNHPDGESLDVALMPIAGGARRHRAIFNLLDRAY